MNLITDRLFLPMYSLNYIHLSSVNLTVFFKLQTYLKCYVVGAIGYKSLSID